MKRITKIILTTTNIMVLLTTVIAMLFIYHKIENSNKTLVYEYKDVLTIKEHEFYGFLIVKEKTIIDTTFESTYFYDHISSENDFYSWTIEVTGEHYE